MEEVLGTGGMRMTKKRVTIVDVANRSGVSRQTVSRVLNKSKNVSEQTRNAVLQAIEELDYVPDPLARNLVTRRTHIIGVITIDFRSMHSQILEGAEMYARENGYQLFISGCEHTTFGEPLYSPMLTRQRIEGMLIAYQGSHQDTHNIFLDLPRDIPIVTTGYGVGRKNVIPVRVANRKGAERAVSHLIAMGRDRIAHIIGPATNYDSEYRFQGYKDALDRAGIALDESLVVGGDWQINSGYEAALELLHRGKRFNALFAHSDWMAVGAMRALKDRGYRVPEDVAIIGFNDNDPARFIEPPLTTVKYPGYALGRVCIQTLIDCIRGNMDHYLNGEVKPLDAELLVRNSCGADRYSRIYENNFPKKQGRFS